ncbi:MAG: hydroxymethylpyrimidine/phosphomethylpyrimidine kinase [Acidimicrobiales bacterium]|nr:MAG: hydroxymethylpyrimidine/phosphomethylpyrimidine kinase [Acidimicrobiales bacterium]
MQPPIALAIAAHDPLGGAGLAADLTTFAAFGVHGMVAVTAVTAQRFGAVDRVSPTDPELLAAQLDQILADVTVSALKVGLLSSAAHVEIIADRIGPHLLPAPVVDPVMVTGQGERFVADDVETAARALLYPRAAVLTPNRAEAALLGPDPAALAALGAPLVVVTGGQHDATDLLIDASGDTRSLPGEWIDTRNVRGSGCTFAAAVTAGLALGRDVDDAVVEAKAFVAARLRDSAGWELGPPGSVGPVAHRLPGERR